MKTQARLTQLTMEMLQEAKKLADADLQTISVTYWDTKELHTWGWEGFARQTQKTGYYSPYHCGGEMVKGEDEAFYEYLILSYLDRLEYIVQAYTTDDEWVRNTFNRVFPKFIKEMKEAA
jgi:hypothetical protein